MADISKFIINSDFPMPAQTGVVSDEVTIPAGTGGGVEVSKTLAVGNASVFRASIWSSRLNKTFVGANNALYTVGSDLYVCALGVSTGGTVTLRVANLGSATSAAETVRFTLSCFTLP